MKTLRKLLILSHRYLGIAVSLLAVMWFATGITMMYVGGMPRLTPERRLASLPEIDLSQVKITAAEAAARAEYDPPPSATLVNVMNRPAYRFGRPDPVTVFADTGELLAPIEAPAARRVAADFMRLPEDRVAFVETIVDTDQWTLGQAQPPLHRFRVDDEEGTELYVAPGTADVVQLTTRRGRALAWVSTIPHWLYFSALRNNQPLWYRIVVWGSGLVCVAAVLGLALGVTQWRRRKPFDLSASIPYRGAMRWHYVTGVVFGVFTFTFAFSGLLSMEPFAWTSAPDLRIPREALTGGDLQLARFPAMQPEPWAALLGGRALKEVDFVRLQDEPYFVVRSTERAGAEVKRERLHQPYYITGRAERDRMVVAAGTLEPRQTPFTATSLETRVRAALPDVQVVETALLTEYDSYYYSRNGQAPLPVVRLKLDDPAETWVYIDPEMSQILSQVHRLSRVERWLYNGLHSLDFAFWYNRRPLWDIGMIVLLLGGLMTSGIGLVLGVRRIRRGAARALAPSVTADVERAAPGRPASA